MRVQKKRNFQLKKVIKIITKLLSSDSYSFVYSAVLIVPVGWLFKSINKYCVLNVLWVLCCGSLIWLAVAGYTTNICNNETKGKFFLLFGD